MMTQMRVHQPRPFVRRQWPKKLWDGHLGAQRIRFAVIGEMAMNFPVSGPGSNHQVQRPRQVSSFGFLEFRCGRALGVNQLLFALVVGGFGMTHYRRPLPLT
jgi:hypothetical protein